MHPSVYIETTIVSYLVARPSRDAVMAERQRQTREWWDTRRTAFRLFTSEGVLSEAGRGEPSMARARLAVLGGVPALESRPETLRLQHALVTRGPLPASAGADADHIAIAAVYGLEFLLTWNCKHIANPRTYPRVARICRGFGFEAPVLLTPHELLRR